MSSVSHVGSPGITHPVKLLLSRRMDKKYLETRGARELPYPATSTSLTWLVSEAVSPLGCEAQGQDSWDLALPSPCAAELGLLLEPNSPQVLSDLYKSLLSLLVRSLLSTGRKNESPCEQQD